MWETLVTLKVVKSVITHTIVKRISDKTLKDAGWSSEYLDDSRGEQRLYMRDR
jgi:hypothetical protein